MDVPSILKKVAVVDAALLVATIAGIALLESSAAAGLRLFELLGVFSAALITSAGLYGMNALT